MDTTKRPSVRASPEEIELILRIGVEISSAHDLDRLLRVTADSIKEMLHYSYCAILLKEGGDVVIRAVTEYPEAIVGRRIPLGEGITGRCAQSGTEALVRDVSRCEHYVHLGNGVFRSELDVPIAFRGKVLGVLNTQSTRVDAFVDRDVHILKILANQIGVALHNATVRTQLELVQDIGIQLVTITRPQELFARIVRQIRERLHHDSCAILRVEGGDLVFEASTGEYSEELLGMRIPIGRGITGRCASGRTVVNVGDIRLEPDYIPSGIEGVRSEIALPIVFENEILGVLTIESKAQDAFDGDDVRLFTILSAQVAVGIHNARMFAAAEEKAVTDALTGLYNYRYFQERLGAEMTRSSRFGHPLALVMIDLDDFKTINDRHGHLKGDQVLREVARILKRNIRRYDEAVSVKEAEIDVASRYGGEEFIVIMLETGAEGGALAAERLRNALETGIGEKVGLRVTGSFGVAAFRSGDDADSLVKRADDAVYAAKKAGKNQVCVAD